MKKKSKKSKISKETFWKEIKDLRGNLDIWEYKDVFFSLFFLKSANLLFLEQQKKKKPYQKNSEKYYRTIFFPENIGWKNLLTKTNKNKKQIRFKLNEIFQELYFHNKNKLNNAFESNFFKKNKNIKPSTLVSLINVIDKNFEVLVKQKDQIFDLFEYFLEQSALLLGKKSADFYTPSSVSKLLISLIFTSSIKQTKKIYDPCFGSGGMLIESFKFLKKRNSNDNNLFFYGQEKNINAWRIGKLNLLLHHISTENISKKANCTFSKDKFKKKTFDYVLANPPFNLEKYWEKEKIKNFSWEFGIPKENANYAWIQHMISKLNDNGVACFLMANISLTDEDNEEIRKKILEKNLVETIIILSEKLFLKTKISVCIWIVRKNRIRKDVLFINGQNFRTMKEKTIYYLSDNDINSIISLYQDFRNNKLTPKDNLCNFVSLSTIADNHYSLLPNQYIEFIDQDFENINVNDQIKIQIKKLEVLDTLEIKTKNNLQKFNLKLKNN